MVGLESSPPSPGRLNRDPGPRPFAGQAKYAAAPSPRSTTTPTRARRPGCAAGVVSSLGGLGVTGGFTPIVNAPEVAILGVSRATMKPVWNGKEFVPRLLLPLSLSYDHRVIDGAYAARFTVFLVKALSDLRRLTL